MVDASSDSEALKLIIDLVKIVSLEFLVSGGELHTLVPLNVVTRKLKKGLFFFCNIRLRTKQSLICP